MNEDEPEVPESDAPEPAPTPRPAGPERTVFAGHLGTTPPVAPNPFGAVAPPESGDAFATANAEPSLPPARAAEPVGGASIQAFGHGATGALTGFVLNDLFEITRFIARGGMGEVYEGRNLASNERVAIKVILPQFAADESFMALFRREASSLERLGHDALVKYRTLAFDRTSQLNYLVTEYVDGPPMSDVLDGKPAEPAIVRTVLARLAAGLATAHEAGVVHRDLSPDNILLPGGELRRAKIIDFGIAKDTNPGEKSVVGSAFAGKFGYAAPEIFGKYGREVGPWTDVYSLALTVLALANGRPLDMGITIVDALEARDKVPDLSFLADELRPVFEGMLQPDPHQRFRSMDDVLGAIGGGGTTSGATMFGVGGYGGGAATSPPAAGSPVSSPSFVRATTQPPVADAPKSRTPLFAGIGAVALLAVVGGYFAFAGSGDKKPAETAAAVPAATSEAAPSAPIAGASAPVWDQAAKSSAASTLAAIPCSDLRVAGSPTAGTVRLAGWYLQGASLPANVGGFRLDASGAMPMPRPSAATCETVDGLRRAAANPQAALEGGFALPAVNTVSYGGGAGNVDVDLKFDAGATGVKPSVIVSIDDAPGPGEKRVDGGSLPPGFALSAVPFEKKPKRLLVVLLGGRSALPDAAKGTSGLAKACSSDTCHFATGWLELKP